MHGRDKCLKGNGVKNTHARKHKILQLVWQISFRKMRYALPRLEFYYSARAQTFKVREKRPQKQVAGSPLLNKWYPQKLWHISNKTGWHALLVFVNAHSGSLGLPLGDPRSETESLQLTDLVKHKEKRCSIYMKGSENTRIIWVKKHLEWFVQSPQ